MCRTELSCISFLPLPNGPCQATINGHPVAPRHEKKHEISREAKENGSKVRLEPHPTEQHDPMITAVVSIAQIERFFRCTLDKETRTLNSEENETISS
jgi:hypothetical protein